jgi:hypothetical protein
VATDFTFAIIPLSFIMKLHRPLFERVTIGLLISLGALISIIAIVRISVSNVLANTTDPTWDSVDLAVLAVVEMYSGIIAACLPPLKAHFAYLLTRMGMLIPTQSGWSGQLNVVSPDLAQESGLTGDTTLTSQKGLYMSGPTSVNASWEGGESRMGTERGSQKDRVSQ